MHLDESATLFRQRENESDKRTRDIISMKREQVGANTQKKIQIQRQRFTNRNGPSGPSGPGGESAKSETEVKFVNTVTVNFSRNNAIYNIDKSTKYILS